MKRVWIIVSLLVVLLGVVVLPAVALPPNDLNALAQYFPSKTPIFTSFRTDEAYLNTLDALTRRLQTALPDADITPLREVLDEGIAETGLFGSDDFETVVRPWLGDVASLGVVSLEQAFDDTMANDDERPLLFAVQISDRAAAESFWDKVLVDELRFTRASDGSFTVYTPPTNDQDNAPYVALGDRVMFVATQRELLPLTDRSGLGASESFTSTLALLPESDYNISVYLNLGDSLTKAIAEQPDVRPPGMDAVLRLLENFPSMALGFTILDDRSFVMDVAQPFGGLLEAMQDMGIMTELPGPLNPAFAGRIPAGTPLVIHATDLANTYRQVVASFRAQAQMAAEAGADQMPMMGFPTPEAFDEILAQFKVGVQGVTGLNFDEELLPALNSDYALYLSLNPALAEADGMRALMRQLPVDFGFVIALNDPTVIDTLVAGLTNAVEALPVEEQDAEITLGSETIGSETVTLVSIRSDETPFPIELVIGGDDEVFFLGTPNAARASLNPDGTLLNDSAYQEASAYLLDNPRSVAFLSSGGLLPLANVIRETGGMAGENQAEDFLAFLALLNSASISQTYVGEASLSRAVWTLPSSE